MVMSRAIVGGSERWPREEKLMLAGFTYFERKSSASRQLQGSKFTKEKGAG
jgi:hypothetical protein